MFEKLKFWKKDEIDFDALAQQSMKEPMGNPDFGAHDPLFSEETLSSPSLPPSTQSMPASGGGYNPRGSASYSPRQTETVSSNRDLELINSKLDTLKAILNSMDQRIAHLEQTSGVEKKPQRLW